MTIQRKPYKIIPPGFPYAWASSWGEDVYGLWFAFSYSDVQQVFRWIDAGEFMMGSPEDEPERYNNELQHKVILTKGFWIADTACTQELWHAVMSNNPSNFKGDKLPVETVSWEDCIDFIGKVNTSNPMLDFRLPTEAEWEYACRAGTETPFSFGENITTDQVNYYGSFSYAGAEEGGYREKTVAVKSLPSNKWGLYEIHGNVREWCSDWYEDYPGETAIDPKGPGQGDGRVVRGGGWDDLAECVRSAWRGWFGSSFRFRSVGFRLTRSQNSGEEQP
jgi:formylglycine-generating enzyme required for sulfatase activity